MRLANRPQPARAFHKPGRKQWFSCIVLLICGALAQPQNTDYVGPDACRECHALAFRNFENSPHCKTTLSQDHSQGVGCESCHGPGRTHVVSGGDPGKILGFRDVTANDISQRCLSCHQYGQEHENFLRSAHKTSGTSCLDCHSVHHAQTHDALLRAREPQLCYQCHENKASDFALPFHHRVDEGLVRCSDCHNEHGGILRAQLRTSIGQNSICLNCHSEMAGPYVFEHAPQRTEGCTSCHAPHGSPNPRLLIRNEVNLLCLDCHTATFGSAVRDAPGFHDQAAQFQACTLCHAAIHGSNFSRMFFK
jgi:DmsE family decaheme c-type cytochrome